MGNIIATIFAEIQSGVYNTFEDISKLGESLGLDKNSIEVLRDAFNRYLKVKGGVSSQATSNMFDTAKLAAYTAAYSKMGFAVDQINERTLIGLKNINGGIDNVLGLLTSFTKGPRAINSALSSLLSGSPEMLKNIANNSFQREADLLTSIVSSGGLSGDLGKSLTQTINNDVVATAQRLGIEIKEVSSGISSLITNSQRFTLYQGETLLNALKVSEAYGESAKYILENNESFRSVGFSLIDNIEIIDEIGKKSLIQGLNAKETTKTITASIENLNKFGFKDGVQGLSEMARKAQALKFDMESTFRLGEKLFSPDGAIELSAKLQVLGAAFGDLNDPIKLLYDTTNDMGSLQDSLIGAAKSFVTFNDEQGRFEVVGANLRRARDVAKELGMEVEKFVGLGIKGMNQMAALSQIELRGIKDEETLTFLSNLSTMKKGEVGFDISFDMASKLGLKEGFNTIQALSNTQLESIVSLQKAMESKTTEDIIKDQYNVATQTLNSINFIALQVSNLVGNTIRSSDINAKMNEALNNLNNPDNISKDRINQIYNEVLNKEFFKQMFKGGEGIKSNISPSKKIIDNSSKAIDVFKSSEKVSVNKSTVNQHDVNIKVDLMSNNPQLASIMVNQIEKDTTLRTKFIESIIMDPRGYIKPNPNNLS